MNQCDGCRRGLPIWRGTHYNPETAYDTIVCTAQPFEPKIRDYPEIKVTVLDSLKPNTMIVSPDVYSRLKADTPRGAAICGYCAGEDRNYEPVPQRWLSGYWFHTPKANSPLYGAAHCRRMNK